jgi:hypothetical protein
LHEIGFEEQIFGCNYYILNLTHLFMKIQFNGKQKLFGLLFALACFLAPQAGAQVFKVCYFASAGTGTSTDPYIVSVIDGVYPTIDINVYDDPAGTYDCNSGTGTLTTALVWGVIVPNASNAGGVGNPTPTLTQSSPSGISRQITPSGSTRIDPFKFSLNVTKGVQSQDLHFMLVYATSKLADISLVLDVSGSMGIVADAVTSPTDTRLQILQKAASDFIDIYSTFSIGASGGSPDKLGLVYFTTDINPPSGTPTAMVDLDGTTEAGLKADINSKTPQAMTAMGKGINAGVTQLGTDATRTKNIVLFTDGIQNIAPLVDDPGGNLNTLTIAGGPNLITGGSNALQVSVIALIQTTTSYNALLSRIARAANGKFFTVTKTSDVNDFFKYSLAAALKNRSPQIVEFKAGTLASGSATQRFQVNSNVKKVVLELLSNDSTTTFTVEKDDTDVTALGSFKRGNGYLIYSIQLPRAGSPAVISKGEWTMKISGQGNAGYRAMAMVDDHSIKYTPSITSNGRINSPLTISMKATSFGKKISFATVKALILKPGQDLGTLLATTQTPRDTKIKVSEELSPGNAKLQSLLGNPEFLASLLPKEQSLSLTLQSDSTYSATFAGTDVTGAYQVIYSLEAETPQTGKFVRTDMETTVLELDQVALDNSTPSVSRSADTVRLTIRPRSASGLFLGPDYNQQIKLTTSTGKVEKIIDGVDGSYTIVISGVPESVNPDISLTILGQKIYEGALADIAPTPIYKKWWFWLLIALVIVAVWYFFKK